MVQQQVSHASIFFYRFGVRTYDRICYKLPHFPYCKYFLKKRKMVPSDDNWNSIRYKTVGVAGEWNNQTLALIRFNQRY